MQAPKGVMPMTKYDFLTVIFIIMLCLIALK